MLCDVTLTHILSPCITCITSDCFQKSLGVYLCLKWFACKNSTGKFTHSTGTYWHYKWLFSEITWCVCVIRKANCYYCTTQLLKLFGTILPFSSTDFFVVPHSCMGCMHAVCVRYGQGWHLIPGAFLISIMYMISNFTVLHNKLVNTLHHYGPLFAQLATTLAGYTLFVDYGPIEFWVFCVVVSSDATCKYVFGIYGNQVVLRDTTHRTNASKVCK